MVSNLYKAERFYKMQKNGMVAKGYPRKEKLLKDDKGYYLYKNKPSGKEYKQRVKADDKVYSRASGVTMYSKSRDRDVTDVRHKTETPQRHERTAHKYDRSAKTGKQYRV